MEILFGIVSSSWRIFEAAALYLLFGFAVAGIIRVFISTDSVIRYFQRGRFRSVLYASLLGIPIPLCSCGVVPAVAGFKRQGANNGACLSFLTATPETGVDTIALTYSLLGPILTVMRPITAFVTAMTAGLLENFTGSSYRANLDTSLVQNQSGGCCGDATCGCEIQAPSDTLFQKLNAGIGFAFNDLLGDLAGWFALGILLAGVITVLIPSSFINAALGAGLLSYVVAFVISGPIYVCATLSTAVAAALVLKGMSPGAALIMLMAGPATNMTTIAMVLGLLGKRSLVIYLSSIGVCSLLMAYLTDAIYLGFGISAEASTAIVEGGPIWEWAEWTAAVVLGVLILRVLWRNWLKPYWPAESASGGAGASAPKCSCGQCAGESQE